MAKKQKNVWLKALVIALLVLLTPKIFQHITADKGHDIEEVREKIKNHLYKRYGEEFIVDRIGTQTANGDTDYVARIYPKSIIGTKKEGDTYYYAKAAVNITPNGQIGGVGDGYSIVHMNISAEKYLLPEIKRRFGERVLVKIDVKYKKRESKDFFGWRLESDFEKMLNKTKKDPENNRIELELYIYIFDRIDDEKEKEERRKDIFELVQYLKKEGLFKYLEMGVIFIDERVLAPSYDKYKEKIDTSEKVEEEVYGEIVDLPPMDLRKEMSKELQKEIYKMSEKELFANMMKIRKSELSYKGIRKENSQYQERIYSPGILKAEYGTSYDKYVANNQLEHYYCKDISQVELFDNLEYIYLNTKKGE